MFGSFVKIGVIIHSKMRFVQNFFTWSLQSFMNWSFPKVLATCLLNVTMDMFGFKKCGTTFMEEEDVLTIFQKEDFLPCTEKNQKENLSLSSLQGY